MLRKIDRVLDFVESKADNMLDFIEKMFSPRTMTPVGKFGFGVAVGMGMGLMVMAVALRILSFAWTVAGVLLLAAVAYYGSSEVTEILCNWAKEMG